MYQKDKKIWCFTAIFSMEASLGAVLLSYRKTALEVRNGRASMGHFMFVSLLSTPLPKKFQIAHQEVRKEA